MQKVDWIGFDPETKELSQKFKAARTYLKENKPSEAKQKERGLKQKEYSEILKIFRENYNKFPYSQIDIEYLMGNADFTTQGENPKSETLHYETDPGINAGNWVYFRCNEKGIVEKAEFISP